MRAWLQPGIAFTVSLTILTVAGCTKQPEIELPELSLVSMHISDVTMFETVAEFEVRISNGNPEPLAFEGGTVQVYLEDVKVGKGLMSEPVEVPKFSSTAVTLPVYISNLSVATRLQPIIKSKQLSYRIKGVLFQTEETGGRRVRTSHAGTFDFQPDAAAPDGP